MDERWGPTDVPDEAENPLPPNGQAEKPRPWPRTESAPISATPVAPQPPTLPTPPQSQHFAGDAAPAEQPANPAPATPASWPQTDPDAMPKEPLWVPPAQTAANRPFTPDNGETFPAPAGQTDTGTTVPVPTVADEAYPEITRQTKTRPRRGPRLWTVILVALLAGGLAGFGGAFGANKLLSTSTGIPARTAPMIVPDKDSVNWIALVKEVKPTVVSLQVQGAKEAAEGSGVIIDKEGRILTNHHVIAAGGANPKILVTLDSKEIYQAKVVGTDAPTDLAVIALQSPPKDLKAATLGFSSDLEVGEPVAAIGNPLGLSSTVTTGIVSALDRPVMASQNGGKTAKDLTVTNAIQVDAAINPGNSGGPLFNTAGQVVGINSAIASLGGEEKASGSIGLGFAIPIDLARKVADELIATGKVKHAFLGVTLDSVIVEQGTKGQAGAKVTGVQAGSGAAAAGIKVNDVIIEINKDPVVSAPSLTGWVRRYKPGDVVAVGLLRDGKKVEVTVKLGVNPADG